MKKVEEYIQPACVLVLGCIAIICYSLFDINPLLTGGIFLTVLSTLEILSGRAVGTKEFKGLSSTLKIVKRKDKPSEFYFYTLVHAFTGLFLVIIIVLNEKNII